MAHGDREPAAPLAGALPARQPADREVAVGAVAGLAGGTAMWLVAMAVARGDGGFTFPLRLVAAALLGEAALETGAVFWPVALGALLAALVSVLYGLVFASLLRPGAISFTGLLAGLAYAVAVWGWSWFAVVRVIDPILFAAGRPAHMLVLHLVYGAVLGLCVPLLRRVLP